MNEAGSLVPCTRTLIGIFPRRYKLWVDIDHYNALRNERDRLQSELAAYKAALGEHYLAIPAFQL